MTVHDDKLLPNYEPEQTLLPLTCFCQVFCNSNISMH